VKYNKTVISMFIYAWMIGSAATACARHATRQMGSKGYISLPLFCWEWSSYAFVMSALTNP
jgi:hypothetical protein